MAEKPPDPHRLGLLDCRVARTKDPHEDKHREMNAFTTSTWEIEHAPGLFLDVLESHYRRTNNPLYVWWAFKISQDAGLPAPEWVLSYLHESAVQLLNIKGGLKEKTQAAIAEALDLKTTGGGSQFKRFEDDRRNIEICMSVQDEREQCEPLSETDICERVGEKFGLGARAVSRIVKEYSSVLRVRD